MEQPRPVTVGLFLGALVLTLAYHAVAAEPLEAPVGQGEECAEAKEICGRQAFEEGVRAFEGKDYAVAIARFEAALRYRAHPAIALNLALALSASGRYVAASRHLDSVLADASSGAHLRTQAERERSRIEPLFAVVSFDSGDGRAHAHVGDAQVDGEPLGSEPVRVDPGTHLLTFVGAGGRAVERTIELSPGERLRVTVDRTREILVVPERIVRPSAPAKRPAKARPPPPKEREPSGLHPAWFFIGAGATAVLGGVAGWSALDTQSAYDEYQVRVSEASRAELTSRIDEGHGLETRTNVLFAVTGAAALGTAAIGVFLVDWGGGRPGQPMSLGVAPGGVTLRSAF